jgi:hypothetical protein
MSNKLYDAPGGGRAFDEFFSDVSRQGENRRNTRRRAPETG